MNIARKLGITDANPAQLEAITHEGRDPVLVLAGPGSGKTYVITQRIRYLTEIENVSPEKILVLTFTREAAASMKERYLNFSNVKQSNVSQPVKQSDVSQNSQTVNFGTFHSIFYQVLKQSTNFQERQMLTDREKRNLLLPVINQLLPNCSDVWQNNYALQAISAISYYKNSGKRKEATMRLPVELQEIFEGIFTGYERERIKRGKYDYDDLLTDTKRLLSEGSEIRRYWQSRFEHVLIDEFQDVNPAQYEVIRLLAPPPKAVFAVGDDDQSIYGFRGADPDCMRRFAEEYDARRITLRVNYRSRPEIVKASLKMISENKNRFVKKLLSSQELEMEKCKNFLGGMKTIAIRGYQSREEELQGLREACTDFLKKNGEAEPGSNALPKKLAILFRTNRLMGRAALQLRQAGIPHEMREKTENPYFHETALDVLSYLKLAVGEGTPEDLIRIINKPSRFVSREMLSACRMTKGTKDGMAFLEQLADQLEMQRGDVAEKLKILKKQLQIAGKYSAFPLVNYLRRVIGYDRWLSDVSYGFADRTEESKEILEWLTKEAMMHADVRKWISVWGAENAERDQSIEGKRERIILMTVHASKGLEFDKVLIPHCNERIFPHGNMQEPAVTEEERRLFYVAMTRAKEELELTYVAGSKDRPEIPSRFLKNII
ncbi:MAG: ATP-dependent helicase [Acetatifactor sp.]|nr:ATP-dependent helicase [Acetatifactor sp.]